MTNSDPRTVLLTVSGMTCNNCKAHVTKALAAVPGVTGVDVDLQKGAATVQVGDATNMEPLIEAVREAGYEATVVRGPDQTA